MSSNAPADDTKSVKKWARQGEDGNAMVELAIVLPLLMLLLYGIISFGAVYLVDQSLKTAASDGARAALAGTIECKEASLAQQQAMQDLSYLAVSPTVTVQTAYTPCSSAPLNTSGSGEPLTVTVTYPYGQAPLVPASGFFPWVPASITAVSKVEVNQ